jgi:hypothetical protein
MGKVIISTHITVDGVIGPSPEDWAILEGEGERYSGGDRAFHGRQVRMRLIATTAFDSGVVLLVYRPMPNARATAAT